jgi:hypothetical protein
VRGSELTNRNRATRKAYIRSHPVMISFMVSIALGGAAAVGYPRILHGSVIGEALPGGLAVVWGSLYALGGALTACGVLTLHARLEAAGLCLTASAMAVWAICVFDARGFPDGMLVASLFVGLCLGCWARAFLITRQA